MADYRGQQYRPPGIGGFSFFPNGIKFLLIANVGIFLFQMLFGALHFGSMPPIGAYIAAYFYLWPLDSHHFFPWQLLSYMFLHDGFTHILFNMFALWMFGGQVESVWGTKKFLGYYFICGLGGGAAHLIMSSMFGMESGPLLGASGAIFGTMIAYGFMFPEQYVMIYFLFPIKAKYLIGLWIAIEVVATGNGGDNVSHLAHLGGALTGIIYMIVSSQGHLLKFKQRTSEDSSPWQRPRPSKPASPGFFGRSREQGAVDAEYHDLNGGATDSRSTASDVKKARVITQEEIDRILDKIAATGYQNLTEEERDILFEASRRMEEKR